MEQEDNEEKILNPFVPPPKEIVKQERFPKFVLSMENLVTILNSYFCNSLSKKVSQRVVKKVKAIEKMEEEIIEHQVLMENKSVDLVAIAMVNWELLK